MRKCHIFTKNIHKSCDLSTWIMRLKNGPKPIHKTPILIWAKLNLSTMIVKSVNSNIYFCWFYSTKEIIIRVFIELWLSWTYLSFPNVQQICWILHCHWHWLFKGNLIYFLSYNSNLYLRLTSEIGFLVLLHFQKGTPVFLVMISSGWICNLGILICILWILHLYFFEKAGGI